MTKDDTYPYIPSPFLADLDVLKRDPQTQKDSNSKRKETTEQTLVKNKDGNKLHTAR
ncbi:hypothetical protein [Bacillus sp. T33-2]|uniref:hypothetical protein n=1 Tax=Bacillus sp. T33-2 TaxID=2054168 RepID=UPI0015E0AC13|nr:hypothetical protein [Bacillus sp. T33-2]